MSRAGILRLMNAVSWLRRPAITVGPLRWAPWPASCSAIAAPMPAVPPVTIVFIQDLLAAGLSSKILRDIVPCVTGGHGQVRQVRDDLLDQERRIRARREKLEEYLSGERSPRGGIPAHP